MEKAGDGERMFRVSVDAVYGDILLQVIPFTYGYERVGNICPRRLEGYGPTARMTWRIGYLLVIILCLRVRSVDGTLIRVAPVEGDPDLVGDGGTGRRVDI